MMNTTRTILLNAIPVAFMVWLIPLIQDDVMLAAIYVVIIIISLAIKYEKRDGALFAFGFVALLISEYFFISTGVETFNRHSLLGVMPLWLPVLWGYSFIAIRRGIEALTKDS